MQSFRYLSDCKSNVLPNLDLSLPNCEASLNVLGYGLAGFAVMAIKNGNRNLDLCTDKGNLRLVRCVNRSHRRIAKSIGFLQSNRRFRLADRSPASTEVGSQIVCCLQPERCFLN